MNSYYIHTETREIITYSEYMELTELAKLIYERVGTDEQEAQEGRNEDSDDGLETFVGAAIGMALFDGGDSNSPASTMDSSPSLGDFGGGGASGDF